MSTFNAESIQSLLGSEFSCSSYGEAGNIRVTLVRIGQSYNGTRPNDDEQFELLAEAKRKLSEAGISCSVRFRYQNRSTQKWINWPHIWVNRETAAESDKRVDELVAQNKQLLELLATNMGINLEDLQKKLKPEEISSDTPEDTTLPLTEEEAAY